MWNNQLTTQQKESVNLPIACFMNRGSGKSILS